MVTDKNISGLLFCIAHLKLENMFVKHYAPNYVLSLQKNLQSFKLIGINLYEALHK